MTSRRIVERIAVAVLAIVALGSADSVGATATTPPSSEPASSAPQTSAPETTGPAATSPGSTEPAATGTGGTVPATTQPADTLPPTETAPGTAPLTATSEPASEWLEVVPGGDCMCADGGEFRFWVREADPTKVVFFLEGGGACFDATTCAFTSEQSTTYDWNVGDDEHPDLLAGIFDFDNPTNPFADWSFVFVPYCTGDVHLGDLSREYSPELTVEHVGYVNGTAALGYLAEHFPDAEQVVVVGESAGAVASPVYAGLVSDALPDARVTVFADGSGSYPDDPGLSAGIGGLWGSFETMPDWEVNADLTAEEWSIPRFWVQAGLHDPEIVMGRFDFAYDEVQGFFLDLVGADASDVLGMMDANEAAIEAAGVTQHSFTAPGDDHTTTSQDGFYTIEVEGVTLVDWVTALISGTPMDDVRCTDCGGPAPATTA
jgi:hypothetical protein